MIKELVEEFVLKNNTIITSPAGNGSTVLTLYIIIFLLLNDKTILFYNPTGDIDKNFINKFYPLISKNVFFITGSLSLLLDFLNYINYTIDILILDPGDSLMFNKKIYPLLKTVLKNTTIIATSQIRQDPTKSGQIYSPLEEINKSNDYSIFKYSIWIRNVSESVQLFKARYIDVFNQYRIGNQFLRRYLVRFDTKTGVIIE